MNLAGVERVLELEQQLAKRDRQGPPAGAPRRGADGRGRAPGGAAPLAARRDRPLRRRRRARAPRRPPPAAHPQHRPDPRRATRR